MEHKIPCGMIRDTMPLYVEGLTSDETNREIEKHLQDCEQCKALFQDLQAELVCEKPKDVNVDEKEINYLKKIHKNTHKKILVGIIGASLILMISLAVKLYIIGYPIEAYDVSNMKIEGDQFVCTVQLDNNRTTYKGIRMITDDDGETEIVVYGRLASFFSQSYTAQLSIYMEDTTSTLSINGNVIQKNGIIISKLANDLFNAKNKYVGNISADLNLASILKIENDLGGHQNQLQTATVPYGWTLAFENSTLNAITFDSKMKNYACVLMALIDNIGEVHWSYDVGTGEDSEPHANGITQDQCSDYVGGSIKSFSDSPEKVQQLLDILGISN